MPTERMCAGGLGGSMFEVLITFTERQNQMRVDSIELINDGNIPIRIRVWDDNGQEVFNQLFTAGHTENFNNFLVRKRDLAEVGGETFVGSLRRLIDWGYFIGVEPV